MCMYISHYDFYIVHMRLFTGFLSRITVGAAVTVVGLAAYRAYAASRNNSS